MVQVGLRCSTKVQPVLHSLRGRVNGRPPRGLSADSSAWKIVSLSIQVGCRTIPNPYSSISKFGHIKESVLRFTRRRSDENHHEPTLTRESLLRRQLERLGPPLFRKSTAGAESAESRNAFGSNRCKALLEQHLA